ncbi:hypothetical protein MMC24_000618 [Lignoscripta atroalba]|nr:hypothetical protein [Lignoscripta atroalba]
MDDSTLLIASLLLIAIIDSIMAITYFLTRGVVLHNYRGLGAAALRYVRNNCVCHLIWWIALVCLVQVMLLSIGFSVIPGDVSELCQFLMDPMSCERVTDLWEKVSIALGFFSLIPATGLFFGIQYLFRRRHGMMHWHNFNPWWIITGHTLLDVCAVLSILIACSKGWLLNTKSIEDCFKDIIAMGAAAIVAFEIGFVLCIYGLLSAFNCFNLDPDELRRRYRIRNLEQRQRRRRQLDSTQQMEMNDRQARGRDRSAMPSDYVDLSAG